MCTPRGDTFELMEPGGGFREVGREAVTTLEATEGDALSLELVKILLRDDVGLLPKGFIGDFP